MPQSQPENSERNSPITSNLRLLTFASRKKSLFLLVLGSGDI